MTSGQHWSATARKRRAVLRQHFDVSRSFEALKESCVPSYVHPNVLAAGVAWLRLATAARMVRTSAPDGPVLDFGAASGELFHLLPVGTDYHFVEADALLATAVHTFVPGAVRRALDELPDGHFAAICALDSLEHNDDVDDLVERLLPSLREDGVFVLSGPTENTLYRLSRRIAGFDGHYHMTTIYDIERIVSRRLRRTAARRVPMGLLLFSVSCWRRPRQRQDGGKGV